MEQEQRKVSVAQTAPDLPDLDFVTAYDDGDAIVICDKQDPNAWIRAESTVDLEQ